MKKPGGGWGGGGGAAATAAGSSAAELAGNKIAECIGATRTCGSHYRSQIFRTGGSFCRPAPHQCAPLPPAPPLYTQIDRSGSTRHQKVLDIRYRIVMLALPKYAPAAVLTQVPQARWDYAKTLRPGESLAPSNSVPSPLLFYHDKNYL